MPTVAHRVLLQKRTMGGNGMFRKLVFVGLSLGLLASMHACSSDDGESNTGSGTQSTSSGVACIEGLTSLALQPADETFTLDGMSAPPVPFKATGTFADGSTATIDGTRLAWTVAR